MGISTTASYLVWHFCSKISLNKIKNIQKKALRSLLNYYESNHKTLPKKSSKFTMEVRRLRTLALETFKTLNDLNSAFMKNLFAKREVSKRRKNNLEIPNRNTGKFGDKSLRRLGPYIWNGLPEEIKNETSYDKFEEYLNTWYEPAACAPSMK